MILVQPGGLGMRPVQSGSLGMRPVLSSGLGMRLIQPWWPGNETGTIWWPWNEISTEIQKWPVSAFVLCVNARYTNLVNNCSLTVSTLVQGTENSILVNM